MNSHLNMTRRWFLSECGVGLGKMALASLAGLLVLAGSVSPAQANPKGAVDLFGDPLPAGVVARLGTVRFRQPDVRSMAFSPDGKLLATTCQADYFVRVWEVGTGQERLRFAPFDLDQEKNPYCLAFAADGKTLFIGGHRAFLQCDAATGKVLQRFSLNSVRMLTPSPDGKNLAVHASSDVLVFDLGAGEVKTKIATRRDPASMVFFPDSKTLAIAATDEGVGCWDFAKGERIRHLPGSAFSMALSPDGSTLAAGTLEGIRRWELATDKELPLLPTEERVEGLAFVKGGQWLVAGEFQRNIQVWDLASGKVLDRIPGQSKLAVSKDGKLLAYSFRGGIGLWDIDGKRAKESGGHQGTITALAFAPDGRTLASGAADNTVRFWDRKTGKELDRWRLPLSPDIEGITGLAYSPDGRRVAAVGDDGAVRLWDVAAKKEIARLTSRPAEAAKRNSWHDRSWEVQYSHDGKYLFARGNATIRVWETATGKELPAIKAEFNNGRAFARMAFSPNGKTMAVCNMECLLLHDVIGKEKPRLLTGLERFNCFQMAFSPDGRILALAGIFNIHKSQEHYYVMELRDAATTDVLYRIPFGSTHSACFSLAFAGDGRTLILSSCANQPNSKEATDVLLWDLEEIGRLKGHRGRVMKLAVSPDGRFLATGSEDTTILIWDLAKAIQTKPIAPLTARELNRLWIDLADKDGSTAYRATRLLTRGEKQAVPFLKDIFQKLFQGALPKRVAGLVAALASEEFKVRQQAQRELDELGEFAEPALEEALASNPSLEFRQRAEKLLVNMGPARLRLRRAVEILELIGSSEARSVLTVVSQGPRGATLTREANQALNRLKAQRSVR